MSEASPPFEDKLFDTLLLDKKILYNKYNTSTKVLTIKYDNDSYELSLQGFLAIYPTRKEYTLQTAGLYYISCLRYGLYPSFIRDDVINNLHVFQALNKQTHSDFLSLVIVSLPVYLISVISDVPSTPAQEVLKSTHSLPKSVDRKSEGYSSSDNIIYIILIGMGIFMVFLLTLVVVVVLKTMPGTMIERKVFTNATDSVVT
jgi:hypothetical protein